MDIKGTIKARRILPLLCWDVHVMALMNPKARSISALELLKLTQLKARYQWQNDLGFVHSSSYQALVVTDHELKIEWVSEGFAEMTGYSANEVIGNTTKILLGPQTSALSRQEVRQQLKEKEAFEVELMNYRKNGETYTCHVTIYPLINSNHQITHFLALVNDVNSLDKRIYQ